MNLSPSQGEPSQESEESSNRPRRRQTSAETEEATPSESTVWTKLSGLGMILLGAVILILGVISLTDPESSRIRVGALIGGPILIISGLVKVFSN